MARAKLYGIEILRLQRRRHPLERKVGEGFKLHVSIIEILADEWEAFRPQSCAPAVLRGLSVLRVRLYGVIPT